MRTHFGHCNRISPLDVGGELVQHLSQLLKDKEVEEHLPSPLKQQAIDILNRESHRMHQNKENRFRHDEKKSPGRLQIPAESKYATAQKHIDESICSNRSRYATNATLQQSKSKPHLGSSRSPFKELLVNRSRVLRTEKSQERRQERSASYKRQREAIKLIFQKQCEAESEKAFLEDKISELRHLIAEERKLQCRNQLTNCKSANTVETLSRSSKQVSGQLQCNRRKNRDMQLEESTLTEQVDGLLQQKERVSNAVAEESELINMYRVVINELKAQLKSEQVTFGLSKRQRSVVKNELLTANNLLEKTRQKYEMLHDKTRSIVGNVDLQMRAFFR